MKSFFLLQVFAIFLIQTAKCDDSIVSQLDEPLYVSSAVDYDLLLETDRGYREPAVEGPPIYDDEVPVALDDAGQNAPTATGEPLLYGESE
jgi:hypothetical protein